METWKLIVSGVVQGVGFRWSVQNFAKSLKLNGTVKNNPDSTVTITLQAPRKAVRQFIQELPQHISSFAKIKDIKAEELTAVNKMHDFHVLY